MTPFSLAGLTGHVCLSVCLSVCLFYIPGDDFIILSPNKSDIIGVYVCVSLVKNIGAIL